MAGQVSDCLYYQLQSKCARGSRCFFYHRQLEPDICRSFLFNRCKYGTNARQCGKRHVTARDLPAVTNKEKERVKQAKIHAKEALEEFNKPVTNDEEMTQQDRDKIEEADNVDQPTCSGDNHRSPLKGKQLREEFGLEPDLPPGVFVKNLPPTVQLWQLEAKFQKFGKVLKVSIPKKNKERESASWAIIQFEKGNAAENAIKTLNDTKLEGKTLVVKWKNEKEKLFCNVCGMYCASREGLNEHYLEKHNQDNIRESESKDGIISVYVGNLPPKANCKEIKAKFEEFGELVNVDVPKVSVANDYVWTTIHFKKMADADDNRLVVKLKNKKNVKYFCELCEIYCTCQVNLEKHHVGKQHSSKKMEFISNSFDNHEIQEQTRVKQSCLNMQDTTKKASTETVPTIDAIVKNCLAEGNSGSKLESITNKTFSSSGNVSETLYLTKDKHEQNASIIFSNSTNGPQKPKYSTICKSPKPLKTAQICKPLKGFGEGRRHKSGQIECSLCGSTFKSTQDFATHCNSSEEHKAATARLEQRMLAEADRKTTDGATKAVAENKPMGNSLQQKMANQMKIKPARIQREDQNQLLLQQMATQGIRQRQMYQLPNVGLPLYNNPFLLYDGSVNDPTMLLNQVNGLATDPTMLLNQVNGSASDPMMLLNQMNGSASDTTMLFNQMNGSMSDPMMLLNQMKQVSKQSDLIEKAERMALGQIQETIYKHEIDIPKTNVEAFNNADVDREMYMRALTQRQTQLKLEQLYYENKRLAAQMDLNSNIEQMKRLSEIEKQKKRNIFLEQVEIGRLEELRKLKLKDVNTPYAAKKYDQTTQHRSQPHQVNADIFHSEDEEDEEEEETSQDKMTK